MNYQPVKVLSNREIQIISKQSGILMCRYRSHTRTMECLFDFPEQRFGIAVVQEDMPEFAAVNGIISPDTTNTFLAFFQDMATGINSGQCNVKIRTGNGEYRWHHADYSLVPDETGEPPYALITFFDNQEEHELKLAREKWYANLSSVLSEAILYAELNITHNIIERLDGSQSDIFYGIPIETMEDVLPFGMLGEMDTETRNEYFVFFSRQRLLGLFAAGVHEDFFEYCVKNGDGTVKWLRATAGMIRYPHSDDIMAILSIKPLKTRQEELERLSHKAFHDALTGLLNRDGIEQFSEKALAKYVPQISTALFMIDLDNFKQINDHLGHQVGDMVLKQVADALQSSFHQTDIVGRLGGDEFIVLLTGNIHAALLKKKALELITATKFSCGEKQDIAISVSVGIAFGQGGLTFDKLYQMADLALYTAKKAGKCRYHLINVDTNESDGFKETETGSDLLSLQSLLEQADRKPQPANRTPFEAVVENIPGGVVVIEIGKKMQIKQCNNWYYQFSGYTREELEALQRENPFGNVHPGDRNKLGELVRKVRAGLDSVSVVYRIRLANGMYKHIALNASITCRTKKSIVLYGIYTDVNEIVTLQKELDDSRRELDLKGKLPDNG